MNISVLHSDKGLYSILSKGYRFLSHRALTLGTLLSPRYFTSTNPEGTWLSCPGPFQCGVNTGKYCRINLVTKSFLFPLKSVLVRNIILIVGPVLLFIWYIVLWSSYSLQQSHWVADSSIYLFTFAVACGGWQWGIVARLFFQMRVGR